MNLIGALGPELAFDALWYHLTIPKLFVENGSVYYVKGDLLYYSLFPKLTEMLYVSALTLSNEIAAKLIHFSFGILSSIVVYKIARIYSDKFYSLLASLIFYSNLVIGWLSITAFVDLTRTFYEALALYYFLIFSQNLKKKYLFFSGICLGFAIAAKLLSLMTILVFAVLILSIVKLKFKIRLRYAFFHSIISLLIAFPWFLISFFHTNNPVFPLFSRLEYQSSLYFPANPINIFTTFMNLFLFSVDPISPIYLICLPIILLNFKVLLLKYRFLVMYAVLTLFAIYIIPQTGGGRFIAAFLPAYSVVVALVIYNTKEKNVKKMLLFTVFLIFTINISYRLLANKKYFPYLLMRETKEQFLLKNLNFSFGDFYDEGEKIKKIVGDDVVLLLGMHNLFYVDFNYTLEEWENRNLNIKFVLVQGGAITDNYKDAKLVYENIRTRVKLYKLE